MSTSLPPAFSLGPVSTLQEMLRTIAFVNRSLPFLRPTGRFDEETLEAVMMFQKINGFPVTGIVDRRTWDAIMNAFLQAYSHLHRPALSPFFPKVRNRSTPAKVLPYSVLSKICSVHWLKFWRESHLPPPQVSWMRTPQLTFAGSRDTPAFRKPAFWIKTPGKCWFVCLKPLSHKNQCKK